MNTKIILNALLFFAFFIVSCNDNENGLNECNGAPVITDIKHTISDETGLESGALGEWIIIEGANFCNVEELFFNDVEANLFQAYIEPNLISINIPRVAPLEVSNTIKITTSKGSVTKSFEIFVPPLVVNGLLNEYTKPGEIAYIEGDNFDIHEVDSLSGAWIEFGGKKLAVYQMSASRLSFEVPKDAQPNTEIYLFRKDTLDNMRIDMKVPGRYKDTRCILYTLTDQDGWDLMPRTNGLGLAGYPDSIAGNYGVFKGEYAPWQWSTEWHISANLPIAVVMPDYMDLIDIPIEDLQIVFEVNVVNDWTGTPFKITLWEFYEYHWMPYANGVAFRTNGWETKRIPLAELRNGEGQSMPIMTESMLLWDWTLRKAFFHGGDYQSNVFICWDNMRIVPKD